MKIHEIVMNILRINKVTMSYSFVLNSMFMSLDKLITSPFEDKLVAPRVGKDKV
jgi:hypothetical protein